MTGLKFDAGEKGVKETEEHRRPARFGHFVSCSSHTDAVQNSPTKHPPPERSTKVCGSRLHCFGGTALGVDC